MEVQNPNTPPNQPNYNFNNGPQPQDANSKKILVGIIAILLGHLGIHKFILGYNNEGIILLVISVVGYMTACFLVGYIFLFATSIIGLVEGIIYLTRSDEEFYNTYMIRKKAWF
ncbi:NINE protein [Myroides ceti]|uniref:NINE protein n=2 Tax=Paenimyroides ceti TaxID=395087 RepID=A0ABT8CZG3_9FLAO|nr:NINE protein [Paenimyroides ceti]MDN3705615.1 NINE protein [Paenimyroides ceti]MDN3709712.1 NINE protein [Paenimyroides ceti]